MSKMKHLLRKLHIGGGGGDAGSSGGSVADHHQQHQQQQHHQRPGEHSRSHHPPIASSSSTSSSSSSRGRVLEATSPAESSGQGARCDAAAAGGGGDFSFFEEEYQMQLALAMSVSDPDGREDPESAQIDAAKRMSLACTPAIAAAGAGGAEPLDEFLSLRYWSYNIVNYDEKVMDGFYDVYGIISNSNLQGKMPSLVDLQAISVSDNIDYEVVLVNRTIDHALQQLERKALSISSECRSEELGPIGSGLVQKIADLVVASMGGPVCDADAMLTRWTMKSIELRTSLNTIVLPLGCLEVGLSRHRALLFKVLADKINLPCRLVKGSYYTGTDDGAVNLIKVDYLSEYIIDLMGAPGALIPAEIPSPPLQNSGLDLVNSDAIAQTVKDLCLVLDKKVNSQYEKTTEISGERSSHESNFASETESSRSQGKTVRPPSEADDVTIAERSNIERFEHDFGRLLPSLIRPQTNTSRTQKAASPAQQMKVDDISKYVVCAAKNPEFAPKLHAVLLESGASPPPDLFSDISSSLDLGEQKVLEEGICKGDKEKECLLHRDKLVSDVGPDLISFLEVHHPKHTDIKSDQKCSAEGMIGKQSNDADPHANFIGSCLHSALVTANEGVMSMDSGASKILQANPRALGIGPVPESAMLSRNAHGCSAQYEVGLGQMEPVNALAASGAQCSHVNAAEVVNTGTKGDIHLKDSRSGVEDFMFKWKGMGSNKSDKLSDASNGRANQVLDVAEWEIPWEDLQIGERIGLGSYGEVYRADWNGTEVAVKKFLDQGLSGDALEQFRCEVKIMLRLRHPNVVLFMGAVTRPPNLSILTEFLPRGSLYRLLHRPKAQAAQLDEKRRLRMALDVAKGMNYLHTSHPTIVHRDLKSPNLLVDKNWVVKVCDFGLSRLQHHTYLSSKSTAGTPEWMAPEVLRNEDSNEKCDVYSFGVILWELATLQMPWSGLNPMQVVGAVGYQDKRLEIPKEVDPTVAQIISDCWHREPNQRPSFAQLMTPLKCLQRLVIENS